MYRNYNEIFRAEFFATFPKIAPKNSWPEIKFVFKSLVRCLNRFLVLLYTVSEKTFQKRFWCVWGDFMFSGLFWNKN